MSCRVFDSEDGSGVLAGSGRIFALSEEGGGGCGCGGV